jgi:TonB family protein
MRLPVALSVAAAFVLTPVAAGYAPSWSQDFSITNSVEPGNRARRDLMRQLQAWWDVHAYYPRHASNNDEAGTVKVHLTILPDGRIWKADLAEGSGSSSLDAAGAVVFREGVVRPFPPGEPQAEIDVPLHYVLAHRHAQPVDAVVSKSTLKGLAAQLQAALTSGDLAAAARLSNQLNASLDGAPAAVAEAAPLDPKALPPFTILNEPVKSPILETMLQRTCTGTVTKGGVKNHPIYGMRSWIQAVFFRKPDGTPWVKFYEGGFAVLSPVTEIGKMVQWAGRQEGHGSAESGTDHFWTLWTVWPDGENHLGGAIGSRVYDKFGNAHSNDIGGPVDLTCATEALPSVQWNDLLAQTRVLPPGDPP